MSMPSLAETDSGRREFLRRGAAFAGLALVAPHALGGASARARNIVTGRRLRIAQIGIGNKGYVDVMACAAHGAEIVAICDVDSAGFGRAGFNAFQLLLGAARYRDYRQMLAEMDDRIDAVVISVPDHAHFPVAMLALERGKHVFVQKPLTHTIGEARLLKAAATKAGVVTQMGNQGHAYEGARLVKEWIEAGVIGPVREVLTWTDRPAWPADAFRHVAAKPPLTLDWPRWIGTGPYREYSPALAPWNWRVWWDYGSGGLGDLGCHLMDAPFWALNLRGPMKVSARSEGLTAANAAKAQVVTYEFPARGALPPVNYTWHDGGMLPPKPEEFGDQPMPRTATLYRGDKGALLSEGDYNQTVRLLPESRMKGFADRPPKTILRAPKNDPYLEWIEACHGGPPPGSNIVDHAADLTETVLVGNLAIRLGRAIRWDPAAMACTGAPEADRYIHAAYRLF